MMPINFIDIPPETGQSPLSDGKSQAHPLSIWERGRPFLLPLIIILAVFSSVSAQEPSDTGEPRLEQYLEAAADNNPGLKSAFNHYLASLEQVPQAASLPDPELAFGYFISPIETRVGPQTARFSLSQMFPWFGTLGAREDVRNNMAKARFEAFQEERNRLFYRVKATWYDLYVLNEKIAILKDNIEILESLEDLVLQRIETAQGSQTDVLRIQIELDDLRISLSNRLDDRRVLHQEFRELMNDETLEFPEKITATALDLPSVEERLREQMVNHNPMLNQLRFRENAAEQSVRVAELEGLPKFGVGFDYILTDRRDLAMTDNGKDAFMARASVQIPLFRNRYRAQKKEASYRKQAVEEEQVSRQNELNTRLEQALRNFRNAGRELELYGNQQIRRTRQAINILIEEYASADTDFEEILRLQRRLLDYQRSREEALGRRNKAVAMVELLTGFYNTELNELNTRDER